MKKMTLKVTLLAAMMVTSGLAMADEAAYKALHAKAVAALDKAASVKGEWRDARWKKATAVKCGDKKMSYLAAADCYAAQGDYDKAMKYAETARFQGEMGYKQAMGQKNAAPRL
jgi:hypothetical protein